MDDAPTDAGGRRLPDVERLVAGLGGFLSQLARRVRQAAMGLAGLAAAIGLVALVLGVWAWHDSVLQLAVLAVICVPAVLAPLFVIRRLKPIAEAVAHPDEAARQARSYFSGLPATPELQELVDEAAGLQRGTGKVRLRGAFRSARLLGSLVEAISPDPRTQPLVAAFHPARLRGIWLAAIASWWLAMVSSVVAIVAAVSLLADAIS